MLINVLYRFPLPPSCVHFNHRIIDPQHGNKDKTGNPWIHCILESCRQRRNKPFNWRFSLSSTISARSKIGFLAKLLFPRKGNMRGNRSLWLVTLQNRLRLLIKLSLFHNTTWRVIHINAIYFTMWYQRCPKTRKLSNYSNHDCPRKFLTRGRTHLYFRSDVSRRLSGKDVARSS